MKKKSKFDSGWFRKVWCLSIFKLCLLFFSVFAAQGVFAQGHVFPVVKVEAQSLALADVLDDLRKQSGYEFVFNMADVKGAKPVTLSRSGAGLDAVLNEVLKTTGLEWSVDRNTVVIRRKPAAALPVVNQKISGVVKDERGGVLPGVSVFLKGTTLGVASDVDGRYELNIPASKDIVLVFSFIGMETQEVPWRGEEKLNVTLKSEATAMDEVVVTGIFNKSRESYTGSVTNISSKEIKMFRGQNLLQTLGNIDPAFNIVQNNEFGSNPNSLPEVNIRGNSSLPGKLSDLSEGVKAELNTPLIIMDGFEISLQKLMDFNDEEIENINLLKDAAATAIYGSRGANGVIVVTTRKPEAGRLKVFAKAGVSLEMPDLSSYDLLNAREKLALEKSLGFYDGGVSNENLYNSIYKDILEGADTYWLSQPLRTGIGQKYNLRLEGGSDEFRWSGAVGYRETIGVMKNSERKVLDGTLNLSYSLKNLIFQNQLSISSTKSQESNYGTFSDYVRMNPYWRPYDEKGRAVKAYPGNPMEGSGDTPNPLRDAELNTKDERKETQIMNNFSLEWTIVPGMLARAQFGISKTIGRSDKFLPAEHSKFKNYSADDYFRKGEYTYGVNEALMLDGNVTLNYSRTFAKKHAVYAGLNYSVNQSDSYGYTFMAEGFLDETFDFISNAVGYEKNGKPGATENISRRIGFTGNVNYTYDNRYYADFSYRMDGSSQFGKSQQFAPFWSVGAGWNVHRERFMEGQSVISNLRLKASAGETGSQSFSPYQALAMYNYILTDRYGLWSGAFLNGLGNDELTWQSTMVYNGGIELGLWNNRVKASLDVYTKETTNLLSSVALPLSTGYSSYMANVGTVRNQGFEAMVSGYLVRNTEKDIMWSLTGKITYDKNEIVKLSDAIKQQTADAEKQNVEMGNLLYEGNSVNSIYAVRSLGIDPSCGEEIFLDKDGNRTYKWNGNSRRLAGNSEPKYRGNFSSYFSWKDLTVNCSFAYHWGGQQYNTTVRDRVEASRSEIFYNVDRRVLTDRWAKPGDVVPYKKIGRFSTLWSSRFVQDDNMFSLQNVSVSYRLHTDWVRRNMGMESILLSANMSDVFYLSTIKRERGTGYPFARQMMFDVSIVF